MQLQSMYPLLFNRVEQYLDSLQIPLGEDNKGMGTKCVGMGTTTVGMGTTSRVWVCKLIAMSIFIRNH